MTTTRIFGLNPRYLVDYKLTRSMLAVAIGLF